MDRHAIRATRSVRPMNRWGRVVVAVALAMPLMSTSTVAADGEPAPGFGVDGVVIDHLSAAHPAIVEAIDVINDAEGNVLVGGQVLMNPTTSAFVARYLPNGTRDPSFGQNGMVFLGPDSDQIVPLSALASLATGSVLVTGFGQANRVLTHAGSVTSLASSNSSHLVVLPDGRVLAAGTHVDRGETSMFTVIDPTGGFIGSAGRVTDLVDAQGLSLTGAWLAPSGLVIVSGRSVQQPICVLFAFDAAINVERSFGADGKVTFPQGDAQSCEAAQFPDGNIVMRNSASSSATLVDASGAPIGNSPIPIPNQPFFGQPIIVTDGSGRLLVGAADGHGVRAYFSEGAVDMTFGSSGLASFPDGLLRGIRVLDTGNIALWGRAPGFQNVPLVLKVLSSPWGTAPQPPAVQASKFVPLPPKRILDTREGLGAPLGPLAPGGQVDLQVTGVGGLPANAVSAIVMNVTATDAAQAGFVTAFPSGTRRPTVSNLNLETTGQTNANLVTVKVGANGKVGLFSSGGTHLVADVAGYYTPATTASDGRLQTAAPERILDTRLGLGAPKAKLAAGGQIDLQITGAGPIPAAGVSAVVLNVTADQATANGYVTVWPAGLDRPVVSNLNLITNETRPNLVIVPVGAGGKVSLFSQSGADLVADVAGWFTDSTAADDSVGLFVPITPTRMLDTRLFPAPVVAPGPPGPVFPPPPSVPPPTAPGSTVTRQIGSSGVVPPRASIAVAANITVTQSSGSGFITAWPTNTSRPFVSNLNSTRFGQTIPNAAIVSLGSDQLSLFTQSGAHLIVDINGWYTNH